LLYLKGGAVKLCITTKAKQQSCNREIEEEDRHRKRKK